ncbi:MAG: nucleotidyltransferase family protein [Firmicutes bacterium]|nr:nucleotidyltransferase family protein [Bacillota bacterium]
MNTILGITAEYDPFHNGHAYQIRQARDLCSPDAVVCAMSGDFTQRGEPAILDKWERAALAVRNGVDLVFELPFIYACQRAEIFARGAVDLLVEGGATHISYGCEAEHPEELQRLARLLREHGAELDDSVLEHMHAGFSRAKGTELACRDMFGEELTSLMLEPNNILALEYLKRMLWWEQEKGLVIIPVPVRRFGSGYRQADGETGFAGGTALRQMIAAGQDIGRFVPYETVGLAWEGLDEAHRKLYEQVRGIILRSRTERLSAGYGIGEGMENRLLREAVRCETYEEFLSAMVSRRYTASAIRRIMIWLLMGLTDAEADGLAETAAYGRVLAAGPAGRRLLRELTDAEDAPLIVISDGNRMDSLDHQVREAYRIDRLAADMFHLLCGQPLDENGDGRRHPWMR